MNDDTPATGTDPLDEVRAALDAVDDLPVEQRPAVFSRVNEAIVAELNAMEEV